MDEMYGVMAGFALDFYIESRLSEEESNKVTKVIDGDIEKYINQISDFIKLEINDDKEFLSLLDEYYNNYFLDYILHFSLLDGQVNEVDPDVKDFILFCDRMANTCVKNIVESILYSE